MVKVLRPPSLRFGCFLAPHHPVGEHPTRQFERDLDLVEQLDRLGYAEFWCGEHHSTGWEMIASPELFLAAASQRTRRIMLGTGVVSLPYHHPFNVAQRMVQLDHLSGGRAMFGSGPGALPSDAHTLGVPADVLRDRQDEALGVILRLLRGEERFTVDSEWFTLRDAALPILPLQDDMDVTVASTLSPSGMTLAGKYGIGVLSIGSSSNEGLAALATQWSFAEEAAALHGSVVDRSQWRVLMFWHVAPTREQARAEARLGLQHWHNAYNVDVLGRPGQVRVEDADVLLDQLTDASAIVIGTPDDLVEGIERVRSVAGGFGTVLGFAHDWADLDATRRSWDLVARYVVPHFDSSIAPMLGSAAHVSTNKVELMGNANRAVLAQISRSERAAKELEITLAQRRR